MLSRAERPGAPGLTVALDDGEAAGGTGALARFTPDNAMTPMLSLFDALAMGAPAATLKAGPGRILRAALTYPEPVHG